MAVYAAATTSMPLQPSSVSLQFPLHRTETSGKDSLPRTCITLGTLVDYLKAGYKAFMGGKFPECLQIFTELMQKIPLLVVNNRAEVCNLTPLLPP